MDVDCPDCAVGMKQVQFETGVDGEHRPSVRTEKKRPGLLGQLGLHERKPVITLMCPDCGLLRQYADVDV